MESPTPEQTHLIDLLQKRFVENPKRHADVTWKEIMERLMASPEKLKSLEAMEKSGGEPDVISFDDGTAPYAFLDCTKESPAGRRSCCYDQQALASRKKFPPKTNAQDLASSMGIEILNAEQYRWLQTTGDYDTKTSSWIQTPLKIRNLGGALFADFRFETVFVYHNGAESYYAARGFRGILKI